jgi:small subunit ribosomal protein S6e
MKIVISDPKSGRSTSMEIKDEKTAALAIRKIGDLIDGGVFGMTGYKLKITGGSDSSGFPMDRSIQGTGKIRVLRLVSSSGKKKGQYARATVRGGIVTSDTAQINMKVMEYGEKSIDEIFGPAKAKEDKKEEKPKEEK